MLQDMTKIPLGDRKKMSKNRCQRVQSVSNYNSRGPNKRKASIPTSVRKVKWGPQVFYAVYTRIHISDINFQKHHYDI